MTIQVKLFAGLRDLLPGVSFPHPVEFPEGTTVAEALSFLQVPEDKPKILLVNGRHATAPQALCDGDVLSVFPPVAGG